jgi:hypothetical protein
MNIDLWTDFLEEITEYYYNSVIQWNVKIGSEQAKIKGLKGKRCNNMWQICLFNMYGDKSIVYHPGYFIHLLIAVYDLQ